MAASKSDDVRTSMVISRLLSSGEPSIRWRVRTAVLGEPGDSQEIRLLQDEIRGSARVRTILDACDGLHPYAKWRGSHWALLSLAAVGYPPGDPALNPLRDAVLDTWLAPRFMNDQDVARVTAPGIALAVPRVRGRSRRCGSQQGGALLAIVRLGIDDGRAGTLADRLRDWQWPDGGWNCDRKPETTMSSVNETLLPMRGLAAYADAADDTTARRAATAAAEVLLTRRVAWRRTSGEPITPAVMKLHYPVYWHYDVLAGLVGLTELGLIHDRRCDDALDHLESRRRQDGGWGSGERYWRVADEGAHAESVSWGSSSARGMNEWVTCDALAVLSAAGRL